MDHDVLYVYFNTIVLTYFSSFFTVHVMVLFAIIEGAGCLQNV